MDIAAKLKEIVAESLMVDISAVTDDALFVEDLGADSIAVADIIMSMEDEFDLVIEESDLENLRTVRDAIAFVEARLG